MFKLVYVLMSDYVSNQNILILLSESQIKSNTLLSVMIKHSIISVIKDRYMPEINDFTNVSKLTVVEELQRLVEEKLGLNSTDTIYEDVKPEILKLAAEMFIYLNFCPDNYIRKISFQFISSFSFLLFFT